jgi:hypothetical protein
MIGALRMSARRGAVDKATCDHYHYPVWVSVFGPKYRARCLGCQTLGPVVYEGPLAARRALRLRAGRIHAT